MNEREITKICPYCGSNFVLNENEIVGLKPNCVIPFAFDKEKAIEYYKKNVKHKYYLPNKFKKEPNVESVFGTYISCGSFDCSTKSSFDGAIAISTANSRNGRIENDVTVRHIKGNKDLEFKNYIIESSHLTNQKSFEDIKPFIVDDDTCCEYDKNFLRGYQVESYDNDLKNCKKISEELMKVEIKNKILSQYSYSYVQYFNLTTTFQNNKSILEIDEDDLTEFFYYCKQQGNNTRRIKRRMSAISAFYIFLKKKKITKENPIEYIDRPKKDNDVIVQTFLTQEQVDEILNKLEELPNKLQVLAFVSLALSSLARVNALISCRWEQVNFDECYIEGVVEKEGYVVDLDFDEYTKNILLKLKKQREEHGIDCEYIFCSLYDGEYKQINNSTANDWSKFAGKLIGIETLHCHDFRHSGATLLKNAGMSLEDISKSLNHASTDVTLKHYIKRDMSKLREEKKKYGVMKNRKIDK